MARYPPGHRHPESTEALVAGPDGGLFHRYTAMDEPNVETEVDRSLPGRGRPSLTSWDSSKS